MRVAPWPWLDAERRNVRLGGAARAPAILSAAPGFPKPQGCPWERPAEGVFAPLVGNSRNSTKGTDS